MSLRARRVRIVWAFVPAFFAASAGLQAATFVVGSAGDASDSQPGDGVCETPLGCTLRAAIQEANALAGLDQVHFAIGSGTQTIRPASALPAITAPVVIDGTTQPGFTDRPLIVLDGSRAGGNGLLVTGGGSTLRGLVIDGFSGNGIEVRNGGGNVIETCYVGRDATGDGGRGNGDNGILIESSSDNRIGGPSKAQRNLVSGNTGKGNGGGIRLSGGGGNVVQGNFIGTDITGMLDRGNEGRGISVASSSNNLIGGPAAGAGNLISGNRATGVRLLGGASGNVVQGNFIGTDRTGQPVLKNDRGVQIRGSHQTRVLGNLIGGHVYDGVLILDGSSDNAVEGNLIFYNGQGPLGDPAEQGWGGVFVITGTRNRILSNLIYGNTLLGINLGTDFNPTPNDPGDGDGGANGFQNFPVVTSAHSAGGVVTVNGTLNSTPGSSFIVQLFASPACDVLGYGEGLYPFGQTTVNTNGSGNASFSVSVAIALPAGWAITGTATGPEGTSEFSTCTPLQ
jgi:CSLREA domain-containing protein